MKDVASQGQAYPKTAIGALAGHTKYRTITCFIISCAALCLMNISTIWNF